MAKKSKVVTIYKCESCSKDTEMLYNTTKGKLCANCFLQLASKEDNADYKPIPKEKYVF